MKRRLRLIVVLTALLCGAAPAAHALGGTNTTTSQWGCVGVQALDKIVCFSDPLPERLPLPN